MARELLSEDEWREVDELLFRGERLATVKLIRERSGLGLNQAAEVMYDRYGELRRDHPERFACSHEEYWAGWYS